MEVENLKSLKRRAAVSIITLSALANIYGGTTHAQSIDIPNMKPQDKLELNVEEITQKIPTLKNESSIESLIAKEKAVKERAEEAFRKAEETKKAAEEAKKAKEAKAKLTDEQIAKMVIDGEYGDGEQRQLKLASEGRSYESVQNKVDELTPNPEVKVAPVVKTVASTPVASNEQAPTQAKQTQPAVQPKAASAPVAPTSQGRTMTMEATGYSTAQPGLSRHTANGTDLIANPRVIAVDPNVIPLGSTVTIEGYGTYTAADTGGDIKGTRIDVHFSSVQQALSFGRRSVQITVH